MRFLFLTFTLAFGFVFGLMFVTASAERYSVQVASFADERQALRLVAALEREGFGAYREGVLVNGRPYHRVQVGCFGDAASAEDLAALLRFSAFSEAMVVPLERQVEVPCLLRELGFLTPAPPADWGVAASAEDLVVFWARLGERRGYIAFDGAGWQVLQAEAVAREGDAVLVIRPDGARERLVAQPTGGVTALFEGLEQPRRVIARGLGNADLTLSSGQLLWRSPWAAVVMSGNRVVSLRLEDRLEEAR